MRSLLLGLAVCVVGTLALGLSGLHAGCTTGDSVEEGCKRDEDCPRPDRQMCEVQTGVCVGFTSLPGRVDGGDAEEDLDGGVP